MLVLFSESLKSSSLSFEGLLDPSLLESLIFVVDAQVAVLADTLSIEGPVMVGALVGLLGATLGMVAILAHPIGIVLLGGMGAFGNFISVARYLSLAVLIRVIDRGII